MEVKIETQTLQEVIGKACKVCSYISALPLTGYLKIQVAQNYLQVTGTDHTNQLIISSPGVQGEMNATVDAKLLGSLVSRLSTPLTTLTIEGNNLIVSANGRYEIALVRDVDGSDIKFPTIPFNEQVGTKFISATNVKSILSCNRSCKAEVKEMPALFNYYMDDKRVLTTDFYKVCDNPVSVFDKPVCLPPEVVNLLEVICDEKGLTVQENEEWVLFKSSNCTLYGKKSIKEDLETFPVNDILGSFKDEYSNVCSILKSKLLEALDRISLFSTGLDSNAITLNFTSNGLVLKTNKNNSNEKITYESMINLTEPFSINVDGNFLKNQIASMIRDDIQIKFGTPNGIQLICGGIVQILSSLDEEEVNE